jgi:hypothetical protein
MTVSDLWEPVVAVARLVGLWTLMRQTSRISLLANPTTHEHRCLGVYEHAIDADWQCPPGVCNAL